MDLHESLVTVVGRGAYVSVILLEKFHLIFFGGCSKLMDTRDTRDTVDVSPVYALYYISMRINAWDIRAALYFLFCYIDRTFYR